MPASDRTRASSQASTWGSPKGSQGSPKKSDGLLSGLKIVDLTDAKGAFCTKVLADLGAEVIRVEQPQGNHSDHEAGEGPDDTAYFYHNSNKRHIAINITHPKGRQLLVQLIHAVDVVVESFPPGYLDRQGLGYKTLRADNPGVIMASITGFGQTGPRRDDPSGDLVAAAVGGQTFVTGAQDQPPLTPYGEQTYTTASLFAAVGVLLAVQERRKTGRGRHLDISLQEAVAATLDHVMVRYFTEGVIAQRQGNRHWDHLFYILPCRGGHIHLTPLHRWETLVDWLDGEGLAADLKEEQWQHASYRRDHVDHIVEVLQAWTLTHTADELFHLAQLMQLPWAPVCSIDDVLESPQLASRQFFIEQEVEGEKKSVKCPGRPYRFSSDIMPPPGLSLSPEDTTARVLQEYLGLTEEELADLSRKGVL